uniref:Uncharacterized protein n=1 Tax=Myotis myotis TaxID=51298 RepID=A0A7J7RDJ8_MYOMY|nr:hypothetical protein mMyoMyo1_010377 [Myotis myotis]
MGCQGATVQLQRLMPRTQQDLLGRDPLSLSSPVPQSCRAKGLFHPGTRKNQGLALSQLQKSPLFPSFPCEPPFHAPSQEPRHRGVGAHLYMYTLAHLWQVTTFPLSSNVSSLGHPGPSLQPVADPCRPNWPDLLPICRNEPWLDNCWIWTFLC